MQLNLQVCIGTQFCQLITDLQDTLLLHRRSFSKVQIDGCSQQRVDVRVEVAQLQHSQTHVQRHRTHRQLALGAANVSTGNSADAFELLLQS